MEIPKIFESEYKFACIVWDKEPVSVKELIKLSNEELEWKRTTTYTVLKRLCERGILNNQDGIVTYLDYDELAMADHIGFVSNFPNLKQLYVQGNKLTDLTFTENLPQLTHLDVTNNYITDLRPLQKLQRLETVWCGENSISQGNDLGEDVNVVPDSVAEEGAWWK